jgi:Protein of unknown function (DUF2380)
MTARSFSAARLCLGGLLALAGTGAPLEAADAPSATPVKIAVFEFELVDASPSAVLLGKSTADAASMEKVSSAARQELTQSGRYSVIDASGASPKPADPPLHDCGGCEAGIALRLGAEQSLLGIVKAATQTDYYVVIQIRDARTGKLIDEQGANFAGSQEGWASGVRMLIKHQVLAPHE